MADRIMELSVENLVQQFGIVEANLSERIAELELELEDRGWQRLFGGGAAFEFSREALRIIAREARLFYLKNPLIKRSVDLTNAYAFGQGVTIEADHPTVDAVVQAFLNDEINRQEITTPRAMARQNTSLMLDGNLLLMFFGSASGDTRVRAVPFDEVDAVLCNPEDASEPWYYQRTILRMGVKDKTVLHPDWQYTPPNRLDRYQDKPIDWDHPVMHVAVNRLAGMQFGISETYAAQDWARAYNEFLANWATITRALARFAWKVVAKGGAGHRTAIKSALDSGISSGAEFNPAPAAASTFIEDGERTNLQPIKTAGATTSPSDGRRILLMVCAAMGWPETFFGDAEVGTLATAESLDRPTELGMLGRQRLWNEILENVLSFVIERKARSGTVEGLRGDEDEDEWGELKWRYNPGTLDDDDPNEPLPTHISIDFPDIVERSVTERVDAIVKAATMGGQAFAGTIDPEYATRQLLIALGEKSVEEVITELFPADEDVPSDLLDQTEALKATMGSFLTLLKEAEVALE